MMRINHTITQAAEDKSAPLLSQVADGNHFSEFKGMILPGERGEQQLFRAARVGDVGQVDALLKAGIAVDSEVKGRALFMAAEAKSSFVFRWLLNASATLSVTHLGYSIVEYVALFAPWPAAEKETIFFLLSERGLSLHFLQKAACLGYENEITASNLEHATTTESIKNTLALYASANGHIAILERLRQSGVSLTEKGNRGDTALLLATHRGHLEMVQWLLQEGGSLITEEDVNGYTALLLAAYRDHLEMVQWLLQESGSLITEEDVNGYTALLLAAYRGHLEMVQWLLQEGGSLITEEEVNGYTALLLAADRGHLRMVQWLLQEGGSLITEKSINGGTALLLAAYHGHLEMVQWLLQEGGSLITEKTINGYTALLLAADRGHLEMVQWLRQEAGSLITEKNINGDTALLLAADRGHLEMVQWLLQEGGSLITEEDVNGYTALLLAADRGHLEMVQWLLKEGGACITEKSDWGETALLLAAKNGHTEIVYLLLKNKADPNLPNRDTGETPLILAIKKRDKEIVRLLLENEADPHLSNRQTGVTPFSLVSTPDYKDLFYLLFNASSLRKVLGKCRLSDKEVREWIKGANASQELRMLDLSHNALKNLIDPTFIKLLFEKFPSLEKLDLSDNELGHKFIWFSPLSASSIQILARTLIHYPQIRQLNLNFVGLEDRDITDLIEMLDQLPSLEEFLWREVGIYLSKGNDLAAAANRAQIRAWLLKRNATFPSLPARDILERIAHLTKICASSLSSLPAIESQLFYDLNVERPLNTGSLRDLKKFNDYFAIIPKLDKPSKSWKHLLEEKAWWSDADIEASMQASIKQCGRKIRPGASYLLEGQFKEIKPEVSSEEFLYSVGVLPAVDAEGHSLSLLHLFNKELERENKPDQKLSCLSLLTAENLTALAEKKVKSKKVTQEEVEIITAIFLKYVHPCFKQTDFPFRLNVARTLLACNFNEIRVKSYIQERAEQFKASHDVLDEIIPEIENQLKAHVRLFFPYRVHGNHWVLGELLFHKHSPYRYAAELYLHDPYGKNIAFDLRGLSTAIRERWPVMSNIELRESPYREARQAAADHSSCGPIVVADFKLRLEGYSLDRALYPVGTKELRQALVKEIESYYAEIGAPRKDKVSMKAQENPGENSTAQEHKLIPSPQERTLWIRKEMIQRYRTGAMLIEEIAEVFTPSPFVEASIQAKKLKNEKLTFLEERQDHASSLKDFIREKIQSLMELEQIADHQLNAVLYELLKDTCEKLTQYLGNDWLITSYPSTPLGHLYHALKEQMQLLSIPSMAIHLLEADQALHFGKAMMMQLESMHAASKISHSKYYKQNAPLTYKEVWQTKLDTTFELIGRVASLLSAGILTATMVINFPASALFSALVTMAIKHPLKKKVDMVKRTSYVNPAGWVARFLAWARDIENLDPDQLLRNFRLAFTDSDLKKFQEAFIPYAIHRYQNVLHRLTPESAFHLGELFTELAAGIFMLGICSWESNKGASKDMQDLAKLASAWAYYVSCFPLLGKREDMELTTKHGRRYPASAFLRPAGFQLQNEENVSIEIDINPQAILLNEELYKHFKYYADESTTALTASYVGYCIANEEEAQQIREQLCYIRARMQEDKQDIATILKNMAEDQMKAAMAEVRGSKPYQEDAEIQKVFKEILPLVEGLQPDHPKPLIKEEKEARSTATIFKLEADNKRLEKIAVTNKQDKIEERRESEERLGTASKKWALPFIVSASSVHRHSFLNRQQPLPILSALPLPKTVKQQKQAVLKEKHDANQERIATLEDQVARQDETIKDQGKTIKDQGKTIEDQGKTIEDQGKTIEDQGKTIEDQGKTIEDQGKAIGELSNEVKLLKELIKNNFSASSVQVNNPAEIVRKAAVSASHNVHTLFNTPNIVPQIVLPEERVSSRREEKRLCQPSS